MIKEPELSKLKTSISGMFDDTGSSENELTDVSKICQVLRTSTDFGISLSSIQSRIDSFSSNCPSLYSMVINRFCSFISDPSLKILSFIFTISCVSRYFLSMQIDTIQVFHVFSAILLLAVFSIIIDLYIEYKLSGLQSSIIYSVIREGKKIGIPSKDLLVGDILLINSPQIVPADLMLISSENILLNDSFYTEIPNENIAKNLVKSNSEILTGKAKAIVLAVGKNRISERLTGSSIYLERETEMNIWLLKISEVILLLSSILVSVIFLIQVIEIIQDKGGWKEKHLSQLFDSFLIASCLFVLSGYEFINKLFYLRFVGNGKFAKVDEFERTGKISVVCVDIPRVVTSSEVDCIYYGKDYLIEKEKLRDLPNDVAEMSSYILSVVIALNKNNDLEDTMKSFQMFLAKLGNSQKTEPKFSLKESFVDDYNKIQVYVIEEKRTIRVVAFGPTKRIVTLSNLVYSYKGKNENLNEFDRSKILTDFAEIKKQKSFKTFSFAFREMSQQEWRDINGESGKTELKSLTSRLALIFSLSILTPIRTAQILSIKKSVDQGLDIKLVTESSQADSIKFARKSGILPNSYKKNQSELVIEGTDLSIDNSVLLNSPNNTKDHKINQKISKISVLCSAGLSQKNLFYSKLEELIGNIGIARIKKTRIENGVEFQFVIDDLRGLSHVIEDSKESQETVKGAACQFFASYLTVVFLFVFFCVIGKKVMFEFCYVLNGFAILCTGWSALVRFKAIENGGKNRILPDFCVNLAMLWALWVSGKESMADRFKVERNKMGINYLVLVSIEEYYRMCFIFILLKYLVWAAGFRNIRKIWKLRIIDKGIVGLVLCLMIGGIDFFTPDYLRIGNDVLCLKTGLLAGIFSYFIRI